MCLEHAFQRSECLFQASTEGGPHILQKEIERFGKKTNMTLYIDGPQAVEKSATAETRESKRQKAIEKLSGSLDTFETRIDEGTRIRKQHYNDIKKGLGSSFYWSLDIRKEFADTCAAKSGLLRSADVKIASDAEPGDIIISGDSDMLGYANIHTLWRPVSKSVILAYSLPDVLKTLGLSRAQLTALAVVSKNDYQRNIQGLGPASNFGGLTGRKRKKAGHRAAVRLWTLDDIRSHLQQFLSENKKKVKKNIKDDDKEAEFHPATYREKGYVLRGSILTDGFEIKLLAFKLRELQDVRYRRWREDRLPSRLTSTVGGIDYFLQEIRNVLTCKEDIDRLWPGVDVKDIRTLNLDAGQACVIGGSAHLPEELAKRTKGKEVVKDPSPNDMEGIVASEPLDPTSVSISPIPPSSTMASSATALDNSFGSSSNDAARLSSDNVSSSSALAPPSTASPVLSPRPGFFNLAVKAKAVYQPVFKFRRWAQSEKNIIPVGQDRSIADIETYLPPLRGPTSTVVNYIKELEQVEEQLKAFYNGPDDKYKKHQWDMKRAPHGEFQLIAHRLLGIVGGGLGIRSDPSKPVIIGVGLGKFGTKSGLSSLHLTFLSYFVPLVDLRRFFCSHCQVYHHRVVMAAESMGNIVQGYLFDQQRPDYLHPIAPDGTMPWKQEPSSGSSTSSGTVGTSSTTGLTSTGTAAGGSTKAKGQRKRSSTVSSLEQASSKASKM
ncbi:hypothetical protein BGZ96_002787 [Linnemannia gamsii]|uniref:XPG-I domain-containing protein n=1 Tax=Linnemannia gamsii TaxID=64522 RepID=A0ABQ7JL08_9FUNG|nr:hypothetical protein BGZ96_002787 [Linnemannia gamsii]